MRVTRWTAVALAATALAAGCGDDGGSSDEDEITAVLTRYGNDQKELSGCDRYGSERLMRDVYGSRERCRRVARRNDAESPEELKISDVRISRVRVDGGRARARFDARVEGVPVGGELGLARQGDEWRIDELSAGYLRSTLRDGARAGFISEGIGEAAFADRRITSCIARLFPRQDPEMKRFGYRVIGERDGANRRLGARYGRCLAGERPGRLALRQAFEAGIREGGQIPAPIAQCIIRRLRLTVSSRAIAEYFIEAFATEEDPEPTGRLARGIEQATADCIPDGGGLPEGRVT